MADLLPDTVGHLLVTVGAPPVMEVVLPVTAEEGMDPATALGNKLGKI
jgi:hypothetical protein